MLKRVLMGVYRCFGNQFLKSLRKYELRRLAIQLILAHSYLLNSLFDLLAC